MKVLAINGSPKKNGNTATSLAVMGKIFEKHGIEMEIVQVGSMKMAGCMACGACAKVKNGTCPQYKDELGEIFEKAKACDALLLSTPVYYAGAAGGVKAFLDRFFMVNGVNGNIFRHKVGASIASVRRSGGIQAVDELNKYIQYGEMIMPTSNYWAVAHGNQPGEISQDAEGTQIVELLAENMAWIMKVIDSSKIEKPAKQSKVWYSFIR